MISPATPVFVRSAHSFQSVNDESTIVRLFRPADELGEFCEYQGCELRRSDRTVGTYRQQTLAVAALLGKPWWKVTPKEVRFLVKRDERVAVSTRNLRISTYRQIHRWGLLEEKPWANPAMLAIPTIPVPKRKKPPISLLDAKKLVANCSTPNEYRVVYFGLFAGLRVSESASIGQAHVGRDRIILIGKGDKEREVPIHPQLRSVMGCILSESPKNGPVLMNVFSKMRNRLAIRDLKGKPATTHSLRRTCADFMYSYSGVPREVVKAILGHGEEVTDLYAPARFPAMQEAIFSIDFSLGEPVQLALFG